MGDDACSCSEIFGIGPAAGQSRPDIDEDRSRFPVVPVLGSFDMDGRIRITKQVMVYGNQISIALALRHASSEALPFLGKETGKPIIEPVDLGLPCHGDANDKEGSDTLWMRFGIDQCQSATPGIAVNQPALDAEEVAKLLYVTKQVLVVLAERSASGSDACGRLAPQPRWSNWMIR